MGKYENLGEFLRGQKNSSVRLSFSEVEKIIGHRLPRSSRYPAWWSNNPSNNVMTKVWLEAGFKTEQVDIEGRKLVFRRAGKSDPLASQSSKPPRLGARKEHPLYGALKGTVRIM